jgi:hypothetical protein
MGDEMVGVAAYAVHRIRYHDVGLHLVNVTDHFLFEYERIHFGELAVGIFSYGEGGQIEGVRHGLHLLVPGLSHLLFREVEPMALRGGLTPREGQEVYLVAVATLAGECRGRTKAFVVGMRENVEQGRH